MADPRLGRLGVDAHVVRDERLEERAEQRPVSPTRGFGVVPVLLEQCPDPDPEQSRGERRVDQTGAWVATRAGAGDSGLAPTRARDR